MKTINFPGLFLTIEVISYHVYLLVSVCPPKPPIDVQYEIILLEGNNLTISISWDINFSGNILRYIVYISRADDPTTYNGTKFLDNEKYKIVSTLPQ